MKTADIPLKRIVMAGLWLFLIPMVNFSSPVGANDPGAYALAQYTLTITKSGDGSGLVTSTDGGINCGADCSQAYDQGKVVNFTITPDAGSALAGVSGDAECADIYWGIQMFSDIACNVEFRLTTKNIFLSSAAYDGWIRESTETSGVGGVMHSTSNVLNVGDTAKDQQLLSIVSFDTASLPDNAVVSYAEVALKQQGQVGSDFSNFIGRQIDIVTGFFGDSPNLQLTDFQAAASLGTPPKELVVTGDWWRFILRNKFQPLVNLSGLTQFRVHYGAGDNDNGATDYYRFYSGNFAGKASRPRLVIEYYVP